MLTTVLVLATIQFWTAQFQPGYISQLGVYHGDQWKAQSGDDWLAMIPTAKGFELVDTTVYAEHALDEMFDEPGQMSGIRVSTPSWIHPTYLFQGLATLRPRAVPTLYNGFHPLAPSQSLILKNPYPDVELYRLSATGYREGNVLFKNYTLHLDYARTATRRSPKNSYSMNNSRRRPIPDSCRPAILMAITSSISSWTLRITTTSNISCSIFRHTQQQAN